MTHPQCRIPSYGIYQAVTFCYPYTPTRSFLSDPDSKYIFLRLSWTDTAPSTFGRLYGSNTRKLPARLPFLCLPLAPRKVSCCFTAAAVTAVTATALGFWTADGIRNVRISYDGLAPVDGSARFAFGELGGKKKSNDVLIVSHFVERVNV